MSLLGTGCEQSRLVFKPASVVVTSNRRGFSIAIAKEREDFKANAPQKASIK